MNASTKILVSKDDSRAINEFISKRILIYNHNDNAKMVVEFIYDFESVGSGLVQQSMLSFA